MTISIHELRVELDSGKTFSLPTPEISIHELRVELDR